MSFAMRHAMDSIDVMSVRERLDLLQYLAPKLASSENEKTLGANSVTVTPSVGNAPTTSQVLTEMRDSRDFIRSVTDNPERLWKRLQELGREMDGVAANNGKSLMEILTEMRG